MNPVCEHQAGSQAQGRGLGCVMQSGQVLRSLCPLRACFLPLASLLTVDAEALSTHILLMSSLIPASLK